MRESTQVLLRPVISEKSYGLMDRNTYVFVIDPQATKIDVRRAVEPYHGEAAVRASGVVHVQHPPVARHDLGLGDHRRSLRPGRLATCRLVSARHQRATACRWHRVQAGCPCSVLVAFSAWQR